MSELDELAKATQRFQRATPTHPQYQPSPAYVPDYPEIDSGATWVGALGILCGFLGALCLLAAVVCGIVGVQRVQAGDLGGDRFVTAAFAFAVNGLVLIVAMVVLRMLAALALAIRDMARNSFYR